MAPTRKHRAPRLALAKSLDLPLVRAAHSELLSSASDDRSRATLLAAFSKHSAPWLDALPCSNLGLLLTPDQLRIGVCLRLGLNTCASHLCAAKNKKTGEVCRAPVDSTGAHALSCKFSSGRLSRHSAVND